MEKNIKTIYKIINKLIKNNLDLNLNKIIKKIKNSLKKKEYLINIFNKNIKNYKKYILKIYNIKIKEYKYTKIINYEKNKIKNFYKIYKNIKKIKFKIFKKYFYKENINFKKEIKNNKYIENDFLNLNKKISKFDLFFILKLYNIKILKLINLNNNKVKNIIKRINIFFFKKIINKILIIIDNFDRIFKVLNKVKIKYKIIINEMNLINKILKNIIFEYGIKTINKKNVDFNSKYHYAIWIDSSILTNKIKVLKVILKGYKFENKILRKSIVIVSKLRNIK